MGTQLPFQEECCPKGRKYTVQTPWGRPTLPVPMASEQLPLRRTAGFEQARGLLGQIGWPRTPFSSVLQHGISPALCLQVDSTGQRIYGQPHIDNARGCGHTWTNTPGGSGRYRDTTPHGGHFKRGRAAGVLPRARQMAVHNHCVRRQGARCFSTTGGADSAIRRNVLEAIGSYDSEVADELRTNNRYRDLLWEGTIPDLPEFGPPLRAHGGQRCILQGVL
ncbi:uncharacterized protein PGTG_18668 [Puccinia graminis f. sp. tritici CRL 75-36-700-3]|uniref:Uncharacterized protein n=1 Tax=Puccinia graminis f. sp. tritici (strain CRL 75-36-700-3 / race SCCL) TaxID=418459 RepID=E3L921_PUCGT|nr:uncharacterized protein PGTG_18668 [Puccinia graminis f. sp. tritici CRL 75-36-700-3]EFP93046.2 hypothetical protein PGTG_18668 [Puccinia graminis f. sp. tritici CRL 75-36-700-3]